MEIFRTVASFDFVGEVDVCCFCLSVGGPGGIGSRFFEIDVFETDLAAAVADGGEGDDAGGEEGCGRGEEKGFEEVEEEEVGEMVCCELGFAAVDCFGVGCCHDLCILVSFDLSNSRLDCCRK